MSTQACYSEPGGRLSLPPTDVCILSFNENTVSVLKDPERSSLRRSRCDVPPLHSGPGPRRRRERPAAPRPSGPFTLHTPARSSFHAVHMLGMGCFTHKVGSCYVRGSETCVLKNVTSLCVAPCPCVGLTSVLRGGRVAPVLADPSVLEQQDPRQAVLVPGGPAVASSGRGAQAPPITQPCCPLRLSLVWPKVTCSVTHSQGKEKRKGEGRGNSSVAACVLSVLEVLGSTLSPCIKGKKKKKE